MTEHPTDAKFEPPRDNWAWEHYTHNPYNTVPKEPLPAPRTRAVTPEDPIAVDCFYSLRSPYSYLVLDRLLYLASNYNVDMQIRIIFPVAVRMPGTFSGAWYWYGYLMHDTKRVGAFQGIPIVYPDPDPITQDVKGWPDASLRVAPIEEQPYIVNLVRLGAAAQLEGKTLQFFHHVGRRIWGSGQDWTKFLEQDVDAAGMDYGAITKDFQANPDKYDDVWKKNQDDHVMTGHAGVPNMIIQDVGEPFFGQDRFDQFFWRLRQNGLTLRGDPVEPIVPRPLRWPDTQQ